LWLCFPASVFLAGSSTHTGTVDTALCCCLRRSSLSSSGLSFLLLCGDEAHLGLWHRFSLLAFAQTFCVVCKVIYPRFEAGATACNFQQRLAVLRSQSILPANGGVRVASSETFCASARAALEQNSISLGEQFEMVESV
jgi:hypothetical protein